MKNQNAWFVYSKTSRQSWQLHKKYKTEKAAERFVDRNESKLASIICICDREL